MLDPIKEKYRSHSDRDLLHIMLLEFYLLTIKIDKIMDTQKQVAQELKDIAAAVLPLGPKIQKLLDAAANQDNASPELKQAADELKDDVLQIANLFPADQTTPPVTDTPPAGTDQPQ